MNPFRLTSVVAAIAYAAAHDVHAADPKPPAPPATTADKSDEIVMSSHIGNLTGKVVKTSPSSITLSVPETMVTGITRRHVGGYGPHAHGHTVAVPRYGTKLVELTYPVSDKVVVKTVSGKDATLSAVTAGEVVEIHLDKVKEGKIGEKLETHVEVKRIDVPNAAVAKK